MAFIPRIIEKFLDMANLKRHNDNYADIKTELDKFENHVTNKNNPHEVTVNQIGAETPDGAQQKADQVQANLNTHAGNESIHTTQAEKDKLASISEGAEPNQNAFSSVNDLAAKNETDTLSVTGGTGITVTTNPGTNTLTVTATGEATPGPHAASHLEFGSDPIPIATETEGGLMSAADKTLLFETADELTGLAGVGRTTETVKGNADNIAAAMTQLAETVSQVANVKLGFGAVGDGIADDTAARTAAIASLPEGGTIYFPNGEYNMVPLTSAELPQEGAWVWVLDGEPQFIFEGGAAAYRVLHHYPALSPAPGKTIRDTSIRAVLDDTNARFHAFHFDLEAGANATNIDAIRGLIGQLRGKGAASLKAIAATTIGEVGHTSTMTAFAANVEPVSTTQWAYGIEVGVGDSLGGIIPTAGVNIHSSGPDPTGKSMDWGIYIQQCDINRSAFQADVGGSGNFAIFRSRDANTTKFAVKNAGEVESYGSDGNGTGARLYAGSFGGGNGVEVTQGAVKRTNAAGGLIIAAGANAGTVLFLQAGNSNQMDISNNGIATIGATGGRQGTGTINAKGLYDDGAILTCYVMQAWIDGTIDVPFWDSLVLDEPVMEPVLNDKGEIIDQKQIGTIERNHEPARKFAESGMWQLDINAWSEWVKENRRLPAFPDPDQWRNYFNGKMTTGDLIQRLWETVEVQAVHIDSLNNRLNNLENKIAALGVQQR